MSEAAKALEPNQADRECLLSTRVREASIMLDLFEGLGVRSFAVTITNEAGRKVAFTPSRSPKALQTDLPALLLGSCRNRQNVIVRPTPPVGLSLVQLDDLSESQLDRVRSFSFLALETSPGNFQAWLAVKEANADAIRRIKKAASGDPSASGATRLAGSSNFKGKYAPDYPRVRLWSIAPRRTIKLEELSRADLVAPDELSRHDARHAPRVEANHRFLVWPSYARCLAEAPAAKNHDGKDRSAADFQFCLISIDRGWSCEHTAKQLMVESEKARSLGYSYAHFTAKRAASILSSGRS